MVRLQIFDVAFGFELKTKLIQPLKESQLHIFTISVLRLLYKFCSDLIWCELNEMLMANFCDQNYEQSLIVNQELNLFISRNSREFCLIVFLQSSFTPWNHMLANISTFLQLSLQYCCTALHLPKISPLCTPLLLHSIIL